MTAPKGIILQVKSGLGIATMEQLIYLKNLQRAAMKR
jgi:hypothetical protein